MCELAVFHWNEAGDSCPRVVPLINDLDNPWHYECKIEDFSVKTARGNLFAFAADVSCAHHLEYVVNETSSSYYRNGTATSYTTYNVSDAVYGSLSVPTLGAEDGQGDGYGPGLLTNQTLWLNETLCFQEASEVLAEPFYTEDYPQYCDAYRETFGPGGGVFQPLECCIDQLDVILPSEMESIAWFGAAIAGGSLVGYIIFRCIIQSCTYCCCRSQCCPKRVSFTLFRAQPSSGSHNAEENRITCSKSTATALRISGVALSCLGFGLNAVVSARYFSPWTIIMGGIYEGVVGILEGFSAFWIKDGLPLNAVTRETDPARNAGIILCTCFLVAYLSFVGYDIQTRQTCGFDHVDVMFGVGAAVYAFVGLGGSLCFKSLGFAQQVFTDNLALWPAVCTAIKCEPYIRMGIITGALLLGWVGTSVVVVYGEAASAVSG